MNFKKIVLKRKHQPETTLIHKKENDDPLFYCTLCSRFMQYSKLIDGYRCCFCDNELFLVPWNEFKEIFHPPRHSSYTRATKKVHKHMNAWERITVH